MEVLKAINAVQAALAIQGISKDKKNLQQGYNFRGIDDIYNALAPMLAHAGLVVLPSYSDRAVIERETQKGGAIFYTTLKGEFTFRSSKDASEVKVTTYGEAMDTGDKATNKAMSAALKYAFMQTFTIPTEGDNDSETHTHEVAARAKDAPGKGPTITPTTGAWESMDPDMQTFLQDIANNVHALFKRNDARGAWDEIESNKLRQDELLALWTRLESAERSALKKIGAFTMHFAKEAA